MADLAFNIEFGREERRKYLMRKEFEIITAYGSRDTVCVIEPCYTEWLVLCVIIVYIRWEYIYDKREDKYFYVNRDTGEVRHSSPHTQFAAG